MSGRQLAQMRRPARGDEGGKALAVIALPKPLGLPEGEVDEGGCGLLGGGDALFEQAKKAHVIAVFGLCLLLFKAVEVVETLGYFIGVVHAIKIRHSIL